MGGRKKAPKTLKGKIAKGWEKTAKIGLVKGTLVNGLGPKAGTRKKHQKKSCQKRR